MHTYQIIILNQEEKKIQFRFSEGDKFKGKVTRTLEEIVSEGKATISDAEMIESLIKKTSDLYKDESLFDPEFDFPPESE